jgi:hypothetical protein
MGEELAATVGATNKTYVPLHYRKLPVSPANWLLSLQFFNALLREQKTTQSDR